MAMIGAIVLARRDISSTEDEVKNLKNQKSLIEKKIPLLSENSLK